MNCNRLVSTWNAQLKFDRKDIQRKENKIFVGQVINPITKGEIEMNQSRNVNEKYKTVQSQPTPDEQPEFSTSSSTSVLYNGNETNCEGNITIPGAKQRNLGEKQNSIDTSNLKTCKNKLDGEHFNENEPSKETGGFLE